MASHILSHKPVDPEVVAEYDQLVEAFKALNPSYREMEQAKQAWVSGGMPAARQVVARFKDNGATPAIRFKQMTPADEFDQLGAQFAAAARERATQPGSSKQQMLDFARVVIAQLTGQQPNAGATLTDSGDMSKSSSKAHQVDAYEAAVKGLSAPAVTTKANSTPGALAAMLGADQVRKERG